MKKFAVAPILFVLMLAGCGPDLDWVFIPDASQTVREYRESMAIIERSQSKNKSDAVRAVNEQVASSLTRYAGWTPKCNDRVNQSSLIVYRQMVLQFRSQMVRTGRGRNYSDTHAVMSDGALAELVSIEALARSNCARDNTFAVPLS